MMPQPPSLTLFPYTTLFRSCSRECEPLSKLAASTLAVSAPGELARPLVLQRVTEAMQLEAMLLEAISPKQRVTEACHQVLAPRSEEHTSELQSLAYLVCRLL